MVLLGFASCWLPVYIMDFITIAFLLYLSSTINPFIYGEAICLITFEDDTAFIIFSNVIDIATPFAIITVCCVKVFHAVSRSNRVFSHKNNPQRSGRKWKKQKHRL
ncbi:hypothetical protein pdam_00002669 [Pocillopora damicornis]|uniref:G-protein coupled receptors family 1 profile domain-containing protein n=1 Tax=Pocillopora damicornis TaxID=46731 RepID=A0A3M6U318_POCDA|nr:hypothetical protein pdam_00002669 [Pocillopora damicornis]